MLLLQNSSFSLTTTAMATAAAMTFSSGLSAWNVTTAGGAMQGRHLATTDSAASFGSNATHDSQPLRLTSRTERGTATTSSSDVVAELTSGRVISDVGTALLGGGDHGRKKLTDLIADFVKSSSAAAVANWDGQSVTSSYPMDSPPPPSTTSFVDVWNNTGAGDIAETTTTTMMMMMTTTVPSADNAAALLLMEKIVHHNYVVGVVIGTIALILLLVALSCVVVCRRRGGPFVSYASLPSSGGGGTSGSGYDYIYKPLHGGRLDDEYENTFVGVSIPLLQEVSVV